MEERERQERERKEREKRELEQKKQAAESSFATKRADAKSSAIDEESAALKKVVGKAYDEQQQQQSGKLIAASMKESVAKLLYSTDKQAHVRRAVIAKVSEVAPHAAEGMQHLNAVVVGKTGVGKSTLLNEILGLRGTQAAKTGVGRPVTQGKPKEYSTKGLRLWDTKGIEVGTYGPAAVVKDIKGLVDRTALKGDPDAYIHAVWYCVLTQGGRLEDVERDALLELMKVYAGGKLPVIVVLTQAYSKQDAAVMEAEVRKLVDSATKSDGDKKASNVKIVPVVAKEKVMDEFTIKPRGIDVLLRETCTCAIHAALPACQHSVKTQVVEALGAVYGGDAFCTKLTDSGVKAANSKAPEKLSGLSAKMSLLTDVLCAICEQAGVGRSYEERTKAITDSGVMNTVLCWATDAFRQVTTALDEAGERLGAKYVEIQHQVERSSGCQIGSGKSLNDWKTNAKKELKDALQEKAECLAFKKAAELLAPIFADALSKALMSMMKAEVASTKTVAQQIEKDVGNAVRKASEKILSTKPDSTNGCGQFVKK